MKKNIPYLLVFFAFFLQSATAQSSRNDIKIDLKAGTINGQNLCAMHVDQVTDLIGRPSTIDKRFPKDIGLHLMYHEQGLKFGFKPTSIDKTQSIENLTIHLSEKWDKDSKKYYQQFAGKIIPEINGNLKLKNVKKMFSGHKYSIMTPEKFNQKLKDLGLEDLGLEKSEDGDNYYLNVHYKNHGVSISFESTTKFAESVSVSCTYNKK